MIQSETKFLLPTPSNGVLPLYLYKDKVYIATAEEMGFGFLDVAWSRDSIEDARERLEMGVKESMFIGVMDTEPEFPGEPLVSQERRAIAKYIGEKVFKQRDAHEDYLVFASPCGETEPLMFVNRASSYEKAVEIKRRHEPCSQRVIIVKDRRTARSLKAAMEML